LSTAWPIAERQQSYSQAYAVVCSAIKMMQVFHVTAAAITTALLLLLC
jgi:hypothetical protein